MVTRSSAIDVNELEANEMDITNLIGGANVTIDVVKQSPSKKLVILSAGAMKQYEGKERISFLVEIDGTQKGYSPNRSSLKNMATAWGSDTIKWIGKAVSLTVGVINGKDAVIGMPAPPIREEVV